MKIDLSKLEKVVHKSDGKIQSRCPACKERGGDSKGEHLVIFPDGRFGCVANPGDKRHNSEILGLVGMNSVPSIPKLQIHRLVVPESQTIMVVGRLGRQIPTLKEKSEKESASVEQQSAPAPVNEKSTAGEDERPKRPELPPVRPEGMCDEVREFISSPPAAA